MILIGVGSNLAIPNSSPEQIVSQVPSWLAARGILVINSSSLYRTSPVGMLPQTPDFINSVLLVKTSLTPLALLRELQAIESQFGKHTTEPKQLIPKSRCLDLDLLDYQNLIMNHKELVLPHPRLQERLFVLQPLAEVAPAWYHPLLNKSAAELALACSEQKITKLVTKEKIND